MCAALSSIIPRGLRLIRALAHCHLIIVIVLLHAPKIFTSEISFFAFNNIFSASSSCSKWLNERKSEFFLWRLRLLCIMKFCAQFSYIYWHLLSTLMLSKDADDVVRARDYGVLHQNDQLIWNSDCAAISFPAYQISAFFPKKKFFSIFGRSNPKRRWYKFPFFSLFLLSFCFFAHFNFGAFHPFFYGSIAWNTFLCVAQAHVHYALHHLPSQPCPSLVLLS